MIDAEDAHPEEAILDLLGTWTLVKTYRIVEPTGHDADGGAVLLVGSMELGTDETDVLLDFPNGFARAASATEERDVASVCCGMVGTYEAEQRGFA